MMAVYQFIYMRQGHGIIYSTRVATFQYLHIATSSHNKIQNDNSFELPILSHIKIQNDNKHNGRRVVREMKED